MPNGYIFGKNSDRSPNEPNLVIYYPRRKTGEDVLKCTYIEVEQVAESYALYLVQPSWLWGGEMGINEYGVIIGNEAVFTKTRDKKTERLLGMDSLRLALERAKSAAEAKEIIKDLLIRYGQGGNCGFDKSFYYDNSYLINDGKQAFVLETAGREWAEREIVDYYNISNRLSLNSLYQTGGKIKDNFARNRSDFLFSYFSGSKIRETTAKEYLKQQDFSLAVMMAALRHHHREDQKDLYSKGSVRSVCMHASLLGDHTTSSMIVVRRGNYTTVWLTGCSAPCLAIFKPVYFPQCVPPVFTDKEESLNYWLKREYLARAVFAGIIDGAAYRDKARRLQNEFITEESSLLATKPNDKALKAFSERCSRREEELVNSYQDAIDTVKHSGRRLPKLWQKYTKRLGKNVFSRRLADRKK